MLFMSRKRSIGHNRSFRGRSATTFDRWRWRHDRLFRIGMMSTRIDRLFIKDSLLGTMT